MPQSTTNQQCQNKEGGKTFMKKILTILLILTLTLTSISTAFAGNPVNAPGPGTSEIVVTTAPPIFSAIVPSVMAIGVAGTGEVTTATNAKIINMSHGPIKVTGLEVSGKNGWSTVSWDGTNMDREAVGGKKIALVINNCKTTGANAIGFNQSEFPVLTGVDGGANEMTITYDAKLPLQYELLSSTGIVNVSFTLSWATGLQK